MEPITAQVDRLTVKLRLGQDYEGFVQRGGVTSALQSIAETLGLPASDLRLVDVRPGCVLMILELPETAARQLLTIGGNNAPEALRKLGESLNIVRVTPGDAVEAVNFIPNRDVLFKADLCWLHISDLHIKADYDDPKSDTNADLQRFLADLPTCLDDASVKPDVVFFTGDVAQSGSAEEYDHALSFFAKLKQALPEDSRNAPLLTVPGNHDVTWTEIDHEQEIRLRRMLRQAKDLGSVLREHGEYIIKRQREFRRFLEKRQGPSQVDSSDGVSYTKSFSAPARGIRVGVAGLNSSWLSTRKDLLQGRGDASDLVPDLDLQYLRLGSEQLRVANRSLDQQGVNIRIALMHHEPLSQWYSEFDRATQRQELTDYHFILRGHQHETQARIGSKVLGQEDFSELAPGAVHTQPHWYQGFMTTELDLSKHLIKLRAWTVGNQTRRWVPDPEFGTRGVDMRLLTKRLPSVAR
ncbi:MAG: hypothetical protein QOE23_1725 [Pseudonocardiales bacterium]|nr:hypothetical protein [Pseudonocardiales bacterium]